jgi:hypothetical protein
VQIKNNVNFNKKQLKNAVIDKLSAAPSTPVEGQVYFNDGSVTINDKGFYIYQGTTWKKLTDQSMSATDIVTALNTLGQPIGLNVDQVDGYHASAFYLATTALNNITAPSGNVALNGHSITGLKTEDVGNDTTNAATTAFVTRAVSNAIQGLDIKASVKFATVSAFSSHLYSSAGLGSITIPDTPASQTAAFDGQTVAVNDRVLVKHFTTTNSYKNGFYLVTTADTSIVLTRVDLQEGQSISPNAFVFVEQGTTLQDTGWVLSSNSGTVGTNNIVFTQFSSAGIIEVGDGLTKTGNTIQIDTSEVPKKYVQLIGSASANTPITITHNLNATSVVVSIIEVSSNEIVLTDVSIPNPVDITVTFADAITSGQYRVVVIG